MTLRKTLPFENIVGKGEDTGNLHFLLFPDCFQLYQRQKSSFELHLLWWLQMLSILSFGKELTHSHTITPFDAPGKQAF